MALHYDWTKAPNGAPDDNQLAYVACMATMLVGVGDLSTPKGFGEYVLRLKAYESWFGPLWLGPEGSGVRGLAAVAESVRGLRTNVTLEPRGKWFKRMGDRFISETFETER